MLKRESISALLTDREEVHPRAMLAKPVIRGARIMGEPVPITACPRLPHDDILGVLDCAHEIAARQAIVPAPMPPDVE